MTKPMRILSVDPGKTIGYAVANVSKDGIEILEVEQHVTPDWNPEGTPPMLWVFKVDLLVIEDFVGNGPRTSESCHTLKMIGAFKYQADALSVPVKQKAPGVRIRHVKRGEEATGRTLCHHGKDAWAHLLRECEDLGIDYKTVGVTWKN